MVSVRPGQPSAGQRHGDQASCPDATVAALGRLPTSLPRRSPSGARPAVEPEGPETGAEGHLPPPSGCLDPPVVLAAKTRREHRPEGTGAEGTALAALAVPPGARGALGAWGGPPRAGGPRAGPAPRAAQGLEGVEEGRTATRSLSLVKLCTASGSWGKMGAAVLDPSLDDWTLRRTSRKQKKGDGRGEERPEHGGPTSPEGNVMHRPRTPLRSWGAVNQSVLHL